MEIWRLWLCHSTQTFKPNINGEKGFALVSTLVLIPLLITLMITVATGFYILKRKSLAQAICVQQAASLQNKLKVPLTKLLQLNIRAKSLRIQRSAADHALRVAILSGVAPAIAAAEAAQLAVILQQAALSAQQFSLLESARQLRVSGMQSLRQQVQSLGIRSVRSKQSFTRSLAVEPRPLNSPSPDYVTIHTFRTGQQQRYQYEVELMPEWPFTHYLTGTKQKTECAVSLKKEGTKWEVDILAAKGP